VTSVVNKTSGGGVLSSFGYEYDISSRRTKITRQDSSYTEYAYNKAGWLTRETRKSSAGVIKWQDLYEYDLVGNRTSKTHLNNEVNIPTTTVTDYEYNDGNQLISEKTGTFNLPSPLQSLLLGEAKDRLSGVASVEILEELGLRLEAVGWRKMGERHELASSFFPHAPGPTSQAFPGNTSETDIFIVVNEDATSMTITVSGQRGQKSYDVFIDKEADIRYTYDANGNLVQKSEHGLATSYQWDHENRLTKVVHPDGKVTSYEYCPACSLGLLAKKTRRDGSTVQWVWDGANVVEEKDSRDGGTVTEYFVNPGSMLGNVVSITRNQEPATRNQYFPMYDAMGTVWQVVNASGGVIETRDFDAWGNELTGILSSSSVTFLVIAQSGGYS
jgi:hypothetical protein